MAGAAVVGIDDELGDLAVGDRVGVGVGRGRGHREAADRVALEGDEHPVAGVAGLASDWCQAAANCSASKESSTSAGSSPAYSCAPGAHLDRGDGGGVVGPADPDGDVGAVGSAELDHPAIVRAVLPGQRPRSGARLARCSSTSTSSSRILDEGVEKGDRTGTGTLQRLRPPDALRPDRGLPAGHHEEGPHPLGLRRAAVVPARRHQRQVAAGPRRHDLGRVGRRGRRPRPGLRPPVALVADARRRARRPGRPGGRPTCAATPTRAGTSSRRGTSPTSRRWRWRRATRSSSSTSPRRRTAGRAGSAASSTSARPTSSSACRSTSPPTPC